MCTSGSVSTGYFVYPDQKPALKHLICQNSARPITGGIRHDPEEWANEQFLLENLAHDQLVLTGVAGAMSAIDGQAILLELDARGRTKTCRKPCVVSQDS